MTVLLGMMAMAIDTGLIFEDRRDLQNDADAAALAGSQHLPANPAMAITKAREWAAKNGISDSQIQSIHTPQKFVPNDSIHVQLTDEFDWVFAKVLGLTTSTVTSEAVATAGGLGGNNNMMPWALLQGESACLDASGDAIFGGGPCIVKVGATASAINGWYGALDFDGTGGGSAEYKANIIDGTTNWRYCIAGDTSPGCVSAVTVVDALSGNKVGPTDTGIDTRLALAGAPCDTGGNGIDDFDEIFWPNPIGPEAYVVGCTNSPRMIIIPIVSYSSTPVQTVTIRAWALAYLESYACVGNCNGNGHWAVTIHIADAAYSQAAGFLTAYDADAGIVVRRLIK